VDRTVGVQQHGGRAEDGEAADKVHVLLGLELDMDHAGLSSDELREDPPDLGQVAQVAEENCTKVPRAPSSRDTSVLVNASTGAGARPGR
jgi:hypothetical protein